MEWLMKKLKSFSVAAIIIVVVLLPIMIFAIPLYIIWKKTDWSSGRKTGVTIAFILGFFLIGAIGGLAERVAMQSVITKPAATSKSSSKSSSLSSSQSASSVSSKVEEVPTSSLSVAESSSQAEVTKDSPYIELSKGTDDYLLLLDIVGKCYIDFTMSSDDVAKLEANEKVNLLVQDILAYKAENDSLLPEFSESFSLFFKDNNRMQDYPDVVQSLYHSFELTYAPDKGLWELIPKGEYIASSTSWADVLGNKVFLNKGDLPYLIGATKQNAYSLLKSFKATENYLPTDPYSIKFENDSLRICTDFNEQWVIEGVYVETFSVDDLVTGEGSYVYKHYDEIVKLATGGQDIKVVPDTEYANLSGKKQYPLALIIGDVHE